MPSLTLLTRWHLYGTSEFSTRSFSSNELGRCRRFSNKTSTDLSGLGYSYRRQCDIFVMARVDGD